MRWGLIIFACCLPACSAGYLSGSKQWGWTIGPAAMMRTETQSGQGWCTDRDPIFEIIEEHRSDASD